MFRLYRWRPWWRWFALWIDLGRYSLRISNRGRKLAWYLMEEE